MGSPDPALWAVEYSPLAAKALGRISPPVRARIVKKLDDLAAAERPEDRCKRLEGALSRFWRLRVGDWRLVLDIKRGKLAVIVIDIGHRSKVYRP